LKKYQTQSEGEYVKGKATGGKRNVGTTRRKKEKNKKKRNSKKGIPFVNTFAKKKKKKKHQKKGKGKKTVEKNKSTKEG